MTDWIKILNNPLFNPVFFLVVRQLTKSIDFDNPAYLQGLRVLYLGSQAVIIALSYLLIAKVRKRNDQTVLRYLEPKQKNWDGTMSEEQLVTTNYADYDVKEIEKTLKTAFTGIAIMAFLHLQFKYVQPLVMQSILGFKTFLTTKEARIHLFGGDTKTGDLKRPFRVELPFGMASESNQPKTDKASIKRAEKARKAN